MKNILFKSFILTLLLTGTAFSVDYFTLGKNAFAKKKYDSANTFFVKAITANPNNATYRYYYGQTLLYLNNYAQAKKEFNYVMLLAPNTQLADYSKQSIQYIDSQTNSTKQVPQNVNNMPQGDNYLAKALNPSGNLVTWNSDRMPLKVYIDNSKHSSVVYVNALKDAVNTWQNVSNGLFSFVFVNDANIADIKIILKGNDKSPSPSLGMTNYSYENEYLHHASIEMYTYDKSYKAYKDYDVYNVTLHELGHALGIGGHSDIENDVMYPTYNANKFTAKRNLSERDKKTMEALYTIDKNPYATGATAITNVLGNKEKRLNTNLNNSLSYVQKLPNTPEGYIDVANSYKELGNETEAINYYMKALAIEPLNHNANYRLGNIYYKRNDVRKAEIYYKNLIKAEPKVSYSYIDLINLYIKNNRKYDAKRYLNILLYRNSSAKNEEVVKNIIRRLEQ